MYFLVDSVLFLFPVFAAGLVFIWVLEKGLLSWLNFPVDMRKKYRGVRVFGDNKTVRGFVVMPVVSAVVAVIVYYLLSQGGVSTSLFYFREVKQAAGVGAVLGLSYVIGELPNSFLKRRLGIAPGQRASSKRPFVRGAFFVLDIVDSLLAVAATGLMLGVSWLVVVVSFLLGVVLHFLTDCYMYCSGLKQSVMW